jgi:methylated-DNA-[protein]-cysteine S-methyltransferase
MTDLISLGITTPVGPMRLTGDGTRLISLTWAEGPESSDALLLEARRQLLDYFAERRRTFDLPLKLDGTPFQLAVWQAMCDIPFGVTASYGDLARKVGASARKVGGACGSNRLPIIVPCHRVIASNGHLTGYSGGRGLETKIWLLRHERALL